jgi:N-methyl-L-proline demethylase
MHAIDPARTSQRAGTSDPLLQPFSIKSLALRNRVISTSHASMLDEGGMPLERYQRYHEERARGGLAMVMVGGSAMSSPDSSWGGGQLDLSTDRVIPHLAALAERIHAQGAAVMCQVSHLGRRATSSAANWLPVLAPSRIRETRNRSFPREMDRSDIDRVVADYAAAARRCIDVGLDGVETVTGGHLIGQFLSPRTNHRSDGFGGTVQNRARFGLMAHEAIRRAVGDRAVVGIRFVIDEGIVGGSDLEDCLMLAKLFESEGHIDFFNCIYGRMDTELALAEDNMPGMFQPSAPFLAKVEQFRRETKLPLLHAAGIRDLATARHAIREGIVDLVGMTRASIADAQIVQKVLAGREDRIRPCVGASYCLQKKVHCIHNPTSGRETVLGTTIEPAPKALKVVIVGGGPAGLEAARVSAERGHAVVLFEAAPKLGGQILVAALVAERRDLIGIVDWRVAELQALGVTVHCNTFADADTILAEAPDAVIVATGGVPDLDWLEGADLCHSVWDVLTGAVAVKGNVLVYDGTGRHPAASCALKLAREGKSVALATPDDALALEMPYTDKASFRRRFAELGIRPMTDMRLVGVARRGNGLVATFRHELTGATCEAEAAHVIVEHGVTPVADLYDALRTEAANQGITDVGWLLGRGDPTVAEPVPGSFVLHRIGDAVASRDIYSSIQEAYRLSARL